MNCFHSNLKVKVKLSHYCCTGAKVERHSSYSFLTLAVDGGEWSVSGPGCTLPPVHIGVTGWTSELVWTHKLEEKLPFSIKY
jgi:hypothetical protein